MLDMKYRIYKWNIERYVTQKDWQEKEKFRIIFRKQNSIKIHNDIQDKYITQVENTRRGGKYVRNTDWGTLSTE